MKNVLPTLCLAAALALTGSRPAAQVVRATGTRLSPALAVHGGVADGRHRGRSHDRGGECRPEYSSARVWIPGAYELVPQRAWVPGCRERVWIEPLFELRTDLCGITVRVQIAPGHWSWVERPGHYETRRVRVWRPGHWAVRGYR